MIDIFGGIKNAFSSKWGSVILGGLETALDLSSSFLPGGSFALKGAKKFGKMFGKASQFSAKVVGAGIGTVKDMMAAGGPMGHFATNFDKELKDGLNQAKADLESQGKALRGEMQGIKSELEGAMKQQGEKLENEIKDLDRRMAQNTGENRQAIENEKKERQAQYQKLQSAIGEVTENLNRVESRLTDALNDFKNEVNEKFEQQEKKILENRRRIEEETKERERKTQEIEDTIKITNTNLKNLRREQAELEDEQLKFKNQINQQTAETQQAFEDAQAEFDRRTRIVEARIEDNQETLEEFNEQLINTQREQSFQRIQQEQIIENLQETNDILFTQQHKLSLVAQQMEEIHEEVHDRMDKLSQKLDERTNETLNIAKDTSQKLDQLTDQVQNIQKETEKLQEQVQKNKEEAEKAKKEAKLANERLDNFLKAQTLSDYSAEQSKLDKIQKSLELKAEETKLLATLNLLQETKKLVQVELSEINWQVGIKKGTEREVPRPEGMLLNPNSSWAKKYTKEQLREWGWDTRLLGEHETAPLTDEDKRKEKQAQTNEQNTTATGEESSQVEQVLKKIEQLKSETLERLSAIQQEIRTGLEEIENSPPPPPSATKQKKRTIQQEIQKKKQQLNQKEQKVQNLAKQLYSTKNQKQLEQAQKEQEKAEKELEQVQAQLSDPSFQFEQEIEKYEETIAEEKQKEVKQQWNQIQALSAQALQEKPEKEEEEKEQKEEDLNKKLEELVQQLKEMEQTQAASQKTMTYAMLFLIIFLMEYIVYKRNGLPGLVVLNIVLLIGYWYKDQLKEYADLWGKYLLIIGYIMGNVLAYSALEQEKYKWPSVAGFNLAVLAIYAYTLYQQKQEQAKIEAFYQQQTKQITEEFNLSEEWKNIQQNSQPKSGIGGIVDEYSVFSNSGELRTEQLNTLKMVNLEKQIAQQKELEIQQQVETLQKAAEIEKNLSQIQEGLGSPRTTWTKIKEVYPEFENKSVLLEELEKANRYLTREEKETDKTFLTKLERLPVPSEEEYQVLNQLHLTVEKFMAISTQAQYLTREEKEALPEIYPTLNTQQKLQLINSGLNNLGINTYEKKEKFVELNHTLYQEQQLFGLTTKEKENILRFMMNTLDLTKEQQEKLEDMGIKPYNATEWTITEEQKDHLLDFGLNKLTLTEEQSEQLADIHPDQFKTFSLTEPQKNILQSLAPLVREDKYSGESLTLLKSLHLKPSTQTFLTNEEIISDPNTSFGVTKSSYLPLKEKFLKGEQRTLLKEKETEEKALKEEEIKQNKLSILRSLMNHASKLESSIKNAREKLNNPVFRESWETEEGTKNYLHQLENERKQTLELSLTLNKWVEKGILTNWQADILLTCGFKTVPRYNFFELLIFCVEKFTGQNWTDFLAGNEELAQEFNHYLERLSNQSVTINQTIWEKFVSSQSKGQREVIQQLNLRELIEEQINQRLGNWKPTYREKVSEEIPSENISEEPREAGQPKPTSSRYADLLSGLNKEEVERQRKKLEREAEKKQFEEQERARRQERLSEKDRKLKEDEERRAKERELAEQEEKKRREAEAARAESLQKQYQASFEKKQANIEEAKRRAEEALANQIKQNEIEEKRKRDKIEKLEKENQAEQARLAKQTQLIEEEKQKKLAAIALTDKEERQRIEKQMNEEKARIQAEMNEKKRKNDEELKKKENALLKEKQEKQLELDKLRKEVNLQNQIAEETKRIANQQVQILKNNRDRESQLRTYRNNLWEEVKNYYWANDEAKDGTRSPQITSGGYLRDWLNSYPDIKFNLVFGDQYSVNWTNKKWKIAMKAFYGCAGNSFVDQYEFRRLLDQKVQSLDFTDSINV